MNSKNKIFATLASVSGVVLIAKILGFFKQVITAQAFGATVQTDLISLSQGLVTDIDYVLIQALMTAFIPIYITVKTKNVESAIKFATNSIKSFFLSTVFLAVLIILFSDSIAKIIAPAYSDALSSQLAFYVRIMAPALIILVQLAIFNALLKANESFLPGELINVNQSIILIVLIFFVGHVIGADTLVVAFYVYAIVSLIFLFLLARTFLGEGQRNPFSDENVQNLLKMMGPLLLGYSMIFLNQQIGKIIVSGIGEGIITAMTYGATLSNFINTFIGSISAVLFTYVTKSIAEKDDQAAAELIIQSEIYLITLILPVSILTVGNAIDIVTIVFKRGAFDVKAVTYSSLALQGYAFMFVPLVVRELYSRLQYAYGDSKQPMINSTIAIIFNIILSIYLGRYYGVWGVTFASSLSVLICALLNIYTAHRKNNFLNNKSILNVVPQWIFGSLLCIIITIAGQIFMTDENIIFRFLTIILFSGFCYCIVMWSVIKPFVLRYFKNNI